VTSPKARASTSPWTGGQGAELGFPAMRD